MKLKLLNELSLRARITKLSETNDSIKKAEADFLKLKLSKLTESVDDRLRKIAELVYNRYGYIRSEDDLEDYLYDEIVFRFGFSPRERDEQADKIQGYVARAMDYYYELVDYEDREYRGLDKSKLSDYEIELSRDLLNQSSTNIDDEELKEIVENIVSTYKGIPDQTVFGDLLYHELERRYKDFNDETLAEAWKIGMRIFKEEHGDDIDELDDSEFSYDDTEHEENDFSLKNLTEDEIDRIVDYVYDTVKNTKNLDEPSIKEAIGLALEDVPGYEITPPEVTDEIIEKIYNRFVELHGTHVGIR